MILRSLCGCTSFRASLRYTDSMANGQDTTTSGEGSLSSTLKTTGRRLTGQRQLLLGVLREHGGHLDAHDLYRLASERNPRLSLSTVYRTMNLPVSYTHLTLPTSDLV